MAGFVTQQLSTNMETYENPPEFEEIPLHQQKVGVWCGLSRKCIIGPIFFDETINAER